MMKSLLIITGGFLPVPAVCGGAVETLIHQILDNNEETPSFQVQVVSCAGRSVKPDALFYRYTKFHFVKYPLWMSACDFLGFWYLDAIRGDWRSMFARTRLRNEYFAKAVCSRFSLRDYDAVIVENNMSLLPAVADALESEFQEKCYFHMHSALIDNRRVIPYLSRCRKILTVSDAVTRLIQAETPELRNVKFQRVTNGIRPQSMPAFSYGEREAFRRRLGVGADELVFLYSGRLSPEKGVRELIRAYGRIADKSTRLLIVGAAVSGRNSKTEYVRQILKEAKPYGDRILWTGYVEHEKIGCYYQIADLLVIPSIVDDAGPLTMLEGMFYGLPIIAAERGGIPEYLSGYDRCVLVPDCQNTEMFAEALRQFARTDWATRSVPNKRPFLYTDKRTFQEFRLAIEE